MLCDICHSNSLTSLGHIQGYREGTRFTIFECAECETSVVDPRRTDNKLYNAIYGNVARTPGYSRYHSLADELLQARDPLKYIADTEECYYAIVKTLNERVLDKSRTKICEVGCGQGYLTYSLLKSGFDCTGVDISENAVALARQRYGDHYFCGNVNDFCNLNGKLDIVVATELIEHLENPVQFIRALFSALGEHGIIVLTTPNKPPRSRQIWDTELPPVHLWWFTRTGLAAMAKQLHCDIDYVDFTDFYKANPHYRLLDANRDRMPIFNQGYELIRPNPVERRFGAAKRRIKRMLPNSMIRKIQQLRAGNNYGGVIDNAHSQTIGAIFTRPDL
jgi:SAM-dependent methyltransferase